MTNPRSDFTLVKARLKESLGLVGRGFAWCLLSIAAASALHLVSKNMGNETAQKIAQYSGDTILLLGILTFGGCGVVALIRIYHGR